MTEQLFNLIDNANDEFTDINELTAAIIELSKHKHVATILIDLLHNAITHHERFWAKIESSDEFKTTYDNDRFKVLKAYDEQKKYQ